METLELIDDGELLQGKREELQRELEAIAAGQPDNSRAAALEALVLDQLARVLLRFERVEDDLRDHERVFDDLYDEIAVLHSLLRRVGSGADDAPDVPERKQGSGVH